MKLALACVTRRPQMWQNVVDNIMRQTRRPDFVVIVAHGDLGDMSIFNPLNSEGGISFVTSHNPQDASLSAGDLTNSVKGFVAYHPFRTDWICSWDDDDFYGANYLAEIERAALAHPDAWILGKAQFPVRWLGGVRDGVTEQVTEAVYENDRAVWVGGPTICVNAQVWREHPTVRYPDMGVGCDGLFLQATGDTFTREHPDQLPPIYHVPEAEFVLQRHAVAGHNHDWVWSKDNEPVGK